MKAKKPATLKQTKVQINKITFVCPGNISFVDTEKLNINMETCPFCKKHPIMITRLNDNNTYHFSIVCFHCRERAMTTIWPSGGPSGDNQFSIGAGPFPWTDTPEQAQNLWNFRN